MFTCPAGDLTTYRLKQVDHKVQFITKRYYESAREVIGTFDFRAAMFATDGERLYTTREAIRDARRKHLTMNAIEYPVATLQRIAKYGRKGYRFTESGAREFIQIVQSSEYDPEHMVLYID